MKTSKHWYESKTIWASIIAFIISALEITRGGLEGGQLDTEALILLITSVIGYYGRITANKEIE